MTYVNFLLLVYNLNTYILHVCIYNLNTCTIFQWLVVNFVKENKCSVIPFTWIANCENVYSSKWPVSSIINPTIKKVNEPNLDLSFTVKIISQVFSM